MTWNDSLWLGIAILLTMPTIVLICEITKHIVKLKKKQKTEEEK